MTLSRASTSPPQILVSFAEGYHFGSLGFDLFRKNLFTSFVATHGNLQTESANAFLLSSDDSILGGSGGRSRAGAGEPATSSSRTTSGSFRP